jgi:hypothetical protein
MGERGLPLTTVAEIAHRRNVPVIVDAAAELPPRENLRNFISQGADLVAFSGGKHIQGPQSTGILCGKKNLILSASLQQQDMDVFPETWPYRHLVAEGLIEGPPHHGLGRGFKAAKEEIIGLLTALQLYQKRDLENELQTWSTRIQIIVKGLAGLDGIGASFVYPSGGGRPVPGHKFKWTKIIDERKIINEQIVDPTLRLRKLCCERPWLSCPKPSGMASRDHRSTPETNFVTAVWFVCRRRTCPI